MVKDYAKNVFVNCPFDEDYNPIRDAIVFAIFDCGFIPRCALEEDDSGEVRFEKIKRLISASKFGVHDVSRTELDDNGLPRFNMPLELGVFIGASKFGDSAQKTKKTLILDRKPYRYQKFISDIAGQTVRSHDNKPSQAISSIRNWLNGASSHRTIPGGAAINTRYQNFRKTFEKTLPNIQLQIGEVTYNDYCNFVSDWLKQQ